MTGIFELQLVRIIEAGESTSDHLQLEMVGQRKAFFCGGGSSAMKSKCRPQPTALRTGLDIVPGRAGSATTLPRSRAQPSHSDDFHPIPAYNPVSSPYPPRYFTVAPLIGD